MTAENKPLPNLELARALGITPQRVSVLKREGMPAHSIEAAIAWREERAVARAARAPVAASAASLDDGTLAGTIAEHRRLVDQARGVWLAAMTGGDTNQAKYQTAYNQSLKSLLSLEEEQERRAILAREFIKATESAETMRRLMAEVVERFDKLALDCAEGCNPENPPKAVKVLEAWARKTRAQLTEGLDDGA